jgi:Icc-related predicted phosphoesterase
MRALHTSDLHGRYKPLLRALSAPDYDLWIDTGDFLPNPQRHLQGLDWHTINRRHQARWLRFKSLPKRIAQALAGRPVILVPGNHDFISLASHLKPLGVPVYELTSGEGVQLGAHRFAGFRHVVRHRGRWSGEIEQADFAPLVDATFDQSPTVLCTHSPAYGVLDHVDDVMQTQDAHIGVKALRDALRDRDHTVRHHLFGHVHETAGMVVERDGITYRNGALGLTHIELA